MKRITRAQASFALAGMGCVFMQLVLSDFKHSRTQCVVCISLLAVILLVLLEPGQSAASWPAASWPAASWLAARSVKSVWPGLAEGFADALTGVADSGKRIIDDTVMPRLDRILAAVQDTGKDAPALQEVAIDADRYPDLTPAQLGTLALDYKIIGYLLCQLRTSDAASYARLMKQIGAPDPTYD